MPHDSGLTPSQKTVSLGIVLLTTGYSAFADIMESIYTLDPLRFEYKFDPYLSEKAWSSLVFTIAGIYGLSTLLCEGKGVYDTVSGFFLERHKKSALPLDEEEAPPSPPLASHRCRFLVWLFPWFISFVSSAADSSETTMGLVKEGAALPKTIAISLLSFLGSISFYGPITVEALEELLFGKNILEQQENPPQRLLSQLIGYPVAIFSSLQDTLECGASLFQNFEISGTTNQWAIVGASSLAGLSGLCLDGKKGVEILDAFFAHLETNQAWLPQVFLNRRTPRRDQLYQLGYELGTTALAAYAASFIAFADKELTIALSKSILATLGAEVPLLPQILGWCVVLRDFVIQTNTLLMLEKMILNASNRSWKKIKQACSKTKPSEEDFPFPSQELETSDSDEDDEKAALLRQHRPSESQERQEKSCLYRFFKCKTAPPKPDYLEPKRRWSCVVM